MAESIIEETERLLAAATPGRWSRLGGWSKDGPSYGVVVDDQSHNVANSNYADAELIAAAPRLLAGLVEAVKAKDEALRGDVAWDLLLEMVNLHNRDYADSVTQHEEDEEAWVGKAFAALVGAALAVPREEQTP